MTAKILICAPSRGFAHLASEIWKQEFERQPEKGFQCEMESIVLSEEMDESVVTVNADAIVARGNSANFMRARYHDIPVIEVPMTGIDILCTLSKCKRKYPDRAIAVIGTINTILDIKRYEDILGLKIVTYEIGDRSQLCRGFVQIKERGIDVVVAGSLTCAMAQKAGFGTVQFVSSRASITQALRLAGRAARDSVARQHEILRYQSMLDCIREGIIGVDTQGRVTIFNHYASELLQVKGENAIGRPVAEVVRNPKLREILQLEGDVSDEIVNNDGIEFYVSKFGVEMRHEYAGEILHLQRVAKIQQLEERIRKRAHLHGLTTKYTFDCIAGESRVLRETIETARIYSQVDANVLIEGMTGTGKELFAQSIHSSSKRKDAPFVAVNCAAIPETLLESELFGYAAGAFTGARRDGKKGLFELAHNGTIFLDEIHGLSMPLQSRLLRVIQEKEIMRIGDDKVIPVDVRIISATNRNLYKLIDAGAFRDDLYFRLDVLKLMLPPLRDRENDVLLLANKFITKFCRKLDRPVISLSEATKQAMLQYSWPGNIRELRNACERICVLCQGDVADIASVGSIPVFS
ncbi:MAG: sigma 54-interacting transcriptional regulator, partial [Oscillospiraceae bacterium]